MSDVLLMSSWILTILLRMQFIFTWPKKKFLGCIALLFLVDVKAFSLARISLEEFSFPVCGYAALFNAGKIFSVNKVALLSFNWKPS